MTAEITIRQAEPHDKAKLKKIFDLSFPTFFRFSEKGKVLIGECNGEVGGFAKLTEFRIAKQKYGCILWLAVAPNFRRKGIASALVQAGTENLKLEGSEAVFASVQRRNKASLATLHKAGFHNVGFAGLWQRFGIRAFKLYSDIWLTPGEIVLMHE